MNTTIRKMIEKKHGLMADVLEIDGCSALEVSRNTAGNMLPPVIQKLTADEAVSFGAWDTSHGTMTVSVRLHPDEFNEHLPVYRDRETGVVYAVRINA